MPPPPEAGEAPPRPNLTWDHVVSGGGHLEDGLVPLVDHADPAGPSAGDGRWSLVLMGDGFDDSETDQDNFDAWCDGLVASLAARAPFSQPDVWDQIALYRARVVSNDSFIYEPGPGSTPLPLSEPRTYFGALHGLGGANSVAWDISLHRQVTRSFGADASIVGANSLYWGGTANSNDIAIATIGEDSYDIVAHELGHLLGLGDEYAQPGDDRARPPNIHRPRVPVEGNVYYVATSPGDGPPRLRAQRLSSIPWRSQLDPRPDADDVLITDGDVILVTNPDCAEPDRRAAIDGHDAHHVGLYEGAHTFRCHAFRAQLNCVMRGGASIDHAVAAGAELTPFCLVCQRLIWGFFAARMMH